MLRVGTDCDCGWLQLTRAARWGWRLQAAVVLAAAAFWLEIRHVLLLYGESHGHYDFS